MICAVFEGDEVCVWCRHARTEHDLFWCAACGGDRHVPDMTDRVSQREGRPTWQWRQVPCACCYDEHGLVRRGGVVDVGGNPVSDDVLDRRGIG